MAITYEPIATTTLSSAASNVDFTSIPGTYTDLIVVVNIKMSSSTGNSVGIRPNLDTTNLYSSTYIYGNGTNALSGRNSNDNFAYLSYFVTPGTNDGFMAIGHIMNYANTTTFKTILSRGSATASTSSYPGAEAIANLYRSTSAITSLRIQTGSTNMASGSTFTLFGIKAA